MKIVSDETLIEALDWVETCGGVRPAGRESGIPRGTLRRRLKTAEQRGLKPSGNDPRDAIMHPEAIKNCQERGIAVGRVTHYWDKDQDTGRSFFVKNPKAKEDPEEFAKYVLAGLRDAEKAKAIRPPALTNDRLSVVFPIADLHIGMLADEEEVGCDWNSKIALGVFEKTFSRLVNTAPFADEAVIANLGDLLHVNDQSNVTPGHKHQLDTDSRFFQTLRRGVAAIKYAVDAALAKYGKVIVRNNRGNHDLTAVYAVTAILAAHYHNEPRVVVEESSSEFYAYQFGKNMVVLCHGDRTTAEKIVMFSASEWPEKWAATSYRIALTGHVHHQSRKEFAGMAVESLGTIIPRDAHSYSNAYGASRALVAIVLDRDDGEVARLRQPVVLN